jgi:hypothetical protein
MIRVVVLNYGLVSSGSQIWDLPESLELNDSDWLVRFGASMILTRHVALPSNTKTSIYYCSVYMSNNICIQNFIIECLSFILRSI